MKKPNTQKGTMYKSSFVLLGLLCLLLTPFSFLHAYFSSVETSGENLFGASSIDLQLDVSGEGADARTFSVVNVGGSLLNYEAYVIETSDSLLSFCDEVNVTLDGSETDLLSFTAPPAVLEAGGAENFNFEFSVDDTHTDLDGKVCTVEFVFEASQEGFSHGEAFYDTETYTLTLYGEDFTTDDPGDGELTAEDCKDGGWESEIFAEFGFENQGHCVSHFATDGISTDARNKNKEAGEATLQVEPLGRPLLLKTQSVEEAEGETPEGEEAVIVEESEEASLASEEDAAIDSLGDGEEEDEEAPVAKEEVAGVEEEEL